MNTNILRGNCFNEVCCLTFLWKISNCIFNLADYSIQNNVPDLEFLQLGLLGDSVRLSVSPDGNRFLLVLQPLSQAQELVAHLP